jgi:Magnesium chelatase, subunit ChlI
MLARRLTTILPAMTLAEALETTGLHRVAGLTGDRTAVVTTRPFHAPHQTIADVGLIGGGQVPTPGDASRAHHSILFLDELPGFCRPVVEVLRQPLNAGVRKPISSRTPLLSWLWPCERRASGRSWVGPPSPVAERQGPTPHRVSRHSCRLDRTIAFRAGRRSHDLRWQAKSCVP